MTREQEIEALRQKVAARDGQTGFRQNVADLKARLAKLEQEAGDAG